MKRISQKKKKLILLLTIGCLIVLIPILIIKTINKKTGDLLLQNAPIKSNYLYQNKSKGFAVYLGSRSSKGIPQVT